MPADFVLGEFLLMLGIGFVAQVVDGTLGMAFGVISTSTMLAIGLPPAQASALVHTAEVFTTGASAVSHIWHRNVSRPASAPPPDGRAAYEHAAGTAPLAIA